MPGQALASESDKLLSTNEHNHEVMWKLLKYTCSMCNDGKGKTETTLDCKANYLRFWVGF